MFLYKNYFLFILLTTFSFSTLSASLTQVHVDSGEVGQGFLVKRLNLCYLVTPEHVLGEEFFANVITGTSLRTLGETERLQSFGYDLSISLVTGAAIKECHTQITTFDAIDDILKNTSNLVVSSINADGSKSDTPVVTIDVGLVYITIKPTSENMPLYKGLSGSVAYVNTTPIGILQSIDANTGEAKLLRMDRAIETIRPFFASSFSVQSNKKQKNSSVKNATPLASLEFNITEWSHPTLNSNYKVSNLHDQNNDSAWLVKPSGGTVELLIDFNKKMQTIKEFTLSNFMDDKTLFPKDIEILASRRGQGSRGWSSVYSGTWINNKPVFDVQIPPIKAKRLKLVIRSNWGSIDKVGLSEISIF